MIASLVTLLASASTQPATQSTGNGSAVGWDATMQALYITGVGMLAILLVMSLFGAIIIAIGKLMPETEGAADASG